MAYQRHYWKDYDETKTEIQNIEAGAVVTTEKLNELEVGIVSKVDETEFSGSMNKKADKTYVDSMLSSIAQGGPRELFYSLAALKSKYPTGADGTYLVFDSAATDGAHSYMWDTGDKLWKDIGVYQANAIANDSISTEKYKDKSVASEKIGVLTTSSPTYTNGTIPPYIEENIGTSKPIFLLLQSTLFIVRKSNLSWEFSLDDLKSSLGESIFTTSPQGVENCITIPSGKFFGFNIATKTPILLDLSAQDDMRIINILGCHNGRVVSGEWRAYLPSHKMIYDNYTAANTSDNQKIVTVEYGDNNLYLRATGLNVRGKNVSYDYTWDTLLGTNLNIPTQTSPAGVEKCIVLIRNQMLVFNMTARKLMIIDRLDYVATSTIVLAIYVGGKLFGGLYYDRYLLDKAEQGETLGNTLANIQKDWKTLYYVTNNSAVTIEPYYGSNVYVKFGTFVGRGGMSPTIAWSALKAQLASATFATSPQGVTDCLVLGNNTALVMDFSGYGLSLVAYTETNKMNHKVLIANVNGSAVEGELLEAEILWKNRNYLNNVVADNDYGFKNKAILRNQIEEFSYTLDTPLFSIAMITDTHYLGSNTTYKESIFHLKQISELANYNSIDMLSHLGDFVDGNRARGTTLRELQQAVKVLSQDTQIPVSISWGNHDDNTFFGNNNGNLYEHAVTKETRYNQIDKRLIQRYNFVSNGDSSYYYKDFESHKIRVINLNSIDIPYIKNDNGTIKYRGQWTFGYSNEQLNWVAHKALELTDKEDWHVVVLTHVPFATGGKNFDAMLGLLQAFSKGSDYSSSSNEEDFSYNVTANYNTKGNIVGVFSGHTHQDLIRVDEEGLTHVTFLNSVAVQTNTSDPARVVGEKSEDSWNVVSFDTINRYVEIKRYGAGQDMYFNYI